MIYVTLTNKQTGRVLSFEDPWECRIEKHYEESTDSRGVVVKHLTATSLSVNGVNYVLGPQGWQGELHVAPKE